MAKQKIRKQKTKETEHVVHDGGSDVVTTRDNVRWMTGFVLLSTSLILFCSILSYFFYWKEDISALSEYSQSLGGVEVRNICGDMGAKLAHLMVGEWFGVFALVIPVVLLIFGWRMFRYKPLRFNYIGISSALILIFGSLSMGYLFGTNWDLYYSGLGGGIGLSMAERMQDVIGGVGTLVVVVAGWILTGLFINRNFIHAVDNAGGYVVGGVSGGARWLWAKVQDMRAKSDDKEENVVPSAAPVAEQGADEGAEQRVEQRAEQEADKGVDSDDAHEDGDSVVPGALGAAVALTTDVADAATAAVEHSVSPVAVNDDYPFKDVNEPIEGGATAANEAANIVSDVAANEPLSPMDVASVLGVGGAAEGAAEDEEGDKDTLVITVEHHEAQTLDAADIADSVYDPMRDLHSYIAPDPSLLNQRADKAVVDEREIFENKELIRETLLNFGIPIRSMHATVGPTVTLYEIVQEQGVKISKIQNLENDIAQNLKALGIRIIAPIPGRGTIGIEVPNITKQVVSMHSAICSKEFQEFRAELPVVIGRTIQNNNYIFDLAKMPHLLVAGATGQGKSVGLNAIITSLLYRKHPAELKFVLIDPKMVEFSLYSKLENHFLAKMESEDEAIVTDPKKAVYTLNALVTEMSNRLELCRKAHAKNIVEYNEKFLKRRLNPENGHRFMPYIVVVIDEFADLIMTAKEVEAPVMRLAQKARAIGIHLIVATQRPDVKVITGGIKANFPARIAFRVMQMTDSRTIIDQPGANQLIGRGDMLFSNGGELTRIQCAFVDTPEVEGIVEHIGNQQGYPSPYALPDYTPESGSGGDAGVYVGSEDSGAPQKYDPKFGDIARDAVANGAISTSMIQRNYEVGFNRAGRIMLQLERAGIVGPQIGSKPREIKFYDLPSLEAKLQELGIF